MYFKFDVNNWKDLKDHLKHASAHLKSVHPGWLKANLSPVIDRCGSWSAVLKLDRKPITFLSFLSSEYVQQAFCTKFNSNLLLLTLLTESGYNQNLKDLDPLCNFCRHTLIYMGWQCYRMVRCASLKLIMMHLGWLGSLQLLQLWQLTRVVVVDASHQVEIIMNPLGWLTTAV